MINVNYHDEAIGYMHRYLDGDLKHVEEKFLRRHLEQCETCQEHFHELNRTITLLQGAEHIQAPANFTGPVMQKLPAEKKSLKYRRWYKAHPIATVVLILLIFLMGAVFSTWNQDGDLVVSKQEGLIIQGDTVIVPSNVTVASDLFVKNGDLIIEGTVNGDITLINGQLVDDAPLENESLMASAGEVNGELQQVNQFLGWIWYQIKDFFQGIFSL